MAKGYALIEQAEQEAEARGERRAFSGSRVSLGQIKKAGGTIIVRPLQQGNEGEIAIDVFPQHEFKVPNKKSDSGWVTERRTCLKERDPNASCPACDAGIPMNPRMAFNMIYRQRPQYRRGSDGKLLTDNNGSWIEEGKADEVVFMDFSRTTGTMIRKKDAKYQGIMSRDWELSYSGDNKDPYVLEPVDVDGGPQSMSDSDLVLAAKKHDLDEVFKPPTLQEMASMVAKYGANSGAQMGQVASAVPQTNPMMQGVSLPPGSPFGAAQPPAPATQQ